MPEYKLQPYGRKHGKSGVIAYAVGPDFIVVQFISREIYLYTYRSAGRAAIEAMKRCASIGRGLSTYISRYTHDKYQAKLA